MPLNVCIIGAGVMGGRHARAWAAQPDVKIVAIADSLREKAEKLAQEVAADAKIFTDYKEAIAYEPVQALSVCMHTLLHSEVAVYAANHKKHVLCEKPLALSLEQGQAMIDAQKKNNVKIAVSFQYRDGWARRCKQWFDEGRFGPKLIMRFADIRDVRPHLQMHRKDDSGGPVVDMACHYFDWMRFVTGCKPVRVYARGHVFGKDKPHLASIADPAVDTAVIQVEYEDGHVLDFTVNWGMPQGFVNFMEESLMGAKGYAKPQDDRILFQDGEHQEYWPINAPKILPERRIADLVAAIREDRAPDATLEDGLLALRTSMAALKSIETGKIEQVA